MGVVESLAAWGIHRPAEVVQIAAACGLDIANAATLLEKESYGGLNLWGSDAVSTGGAYVKGSAVTRESYLRYRELEGRGEAGSQGCGPGQLTSKEFQLQADRLGGCWVWEINLKVAFTLLAGWQRERGIRGGFIRYNGAAEYADDPRIGTMVMLRRWIDRLPAAGQPLTPQQQEEEMAFNEQEEADIVEAARSVLFGIAGQRFAGPMASSVVSLRQQLDGLSAKVEAIHAGPPAQTITGELITAERIDLDALAAKVVDLLAARLRTT